MLADKVRYGGNPEHKRNPGDFGLTPPAAPRRGKSLCDDAGVFRRRDALKLLQEGLITGLIDHRWRADDWPPLVWAVTAEGIPMEAQYQQEYQQGGAYHGYPMPAADPLRDAIAEAWRSHCART